MEKTNESYRNTTEDKSSTYRDASVLAVDSCIQTKITEKIARY